MMRRADPITMIASLIALGFLAATASAAADPNGTWKWKFTRQDGQEMELSVKLKAEGEKLTGELILPMGGQDRNREGHL
jgi:hypothetical protein